MVCAAIQYRPFLLKQNKEPTLRSYHLDSSDFEDGKIKPIDLIVKLLVFLSKGNTRYDLYVIYESDCSK